MTFYPGIKFKHTFIFSAKSSESALSHPVWHTMVYPSVTCSSFSIKRLAQIYNKQQKTELGDLVISEVTSTLIPHPVLTRGACLRGDLFPRAAWLSSSPATQEASITGPGRPGVTAL